jgi:hypothetical protein
MIAVTRGETPSGGVYNRKPQFFLFTSGSRDSLNQTSAQTIGFLYRVRF